MPKTSRKPKPTPPPKDFGAILNSLAFQPVDRHVMAQLAKRADGQTWIVTPTILSFQGQDAEKQAKEAFERLRPSQDKGKAAKPRARDLFGVWIEYAKQKPPEDATIMGGCWRRTCLGNLLWSVSSGYGPGRHCYIDSDRTHWMQMPPPAPYKG